MTFAFAFEEATIAGLADELAAGRCTSLELVAAYRERIEAVDPLLRSVILVLPEAESVAAALDEERRAGHVRGPLHGIPILVKDNIDVDGVPTSAGSLALAEAKPTGDAVVVERLREAGAVVLGKTNLSEWANFRSTRSSSGWSAVGGQCRNPFALDRNPCGSSSGSAVAVAADLCVAAVGTETDGSIVCPSSINGVVGIKPTVGLVSQAGIVPISHTQDTAGPMARTVADAAVMLAALAGQDQPPGLGSGDLRGVRIGVARDLAGFHPQVDACFEEALGALRELGASVEDPVALAHLDELEEPELEVLLFEFKDGLERYLAGLGGEAPRTLEALIAFNEANRAHELSLFGQEVFERAVEKGPLSEPAYLEALATCRRLAWDEGLAVAFAAGVDVLVAPTAGPAWLTDHVNGDHDVGGNSSVAAVSGTPSLTLPMGTVSGLPVGLSFLGPAWSEPLLVRCADAFERATVHWRPPGLLPTLPE